ncbi:MAG TPA: hypothetical protein ENK54_08575 [Thiotrichales bacterium]|nr:hypothetical protein [Thiotrichales bacterium]
MKINRLYKNLMLLAMVIAPAWWLLLTEDGQRRTDTVMLWLLGNPTMEMNLAPLTTEFEEGELMKLFASLAWECADRPSYFGDRLCRAEIGVFNEIPSRYVTLYFREGRISGIKVIYRRRYHDTLRRQLTRQLGEPRLVRAENAEALLAWRTAGGKVLLKERVIPSDEAALLWMGATAGDGREKAENDE